MDLACDRNASVHMIIYDHVIAEMTNPLVGHVIDSHGHVPLSHVIPKVWICHVLGHVLEHMIDQLILSQGHVLGV